MTTTLNVPDISCGHCKSSIEGAVSGLPGVNSADVNIEARTVELDLSDSAQLDQIVDAIEDQGYDVAK
jgi:copper chaperone